MDAASRVYGGNLAIVKGDMAGIIWDDLNGAFLRNSYGEVAGK
jgi:hypothetical protein